MSRPLNREEVCPLNPKPGAPRVAIFSYWNDKYAPLADIARPNWKAYAERHGYGLRFYPGEYHEDPSRPETYGDKGKFELYYDLRGYVDIVMFLDIDSLFMNQDVRVEERLEWASFHKRFVWTHDDNGPLSGFWIARTDAITEKHLRYAYKYAAENNNVKHGKIEPNGISDQDAMRALMRVPPFQGTFQSCWDAAEAGHCYPENWRPGEWLITFPGRSVEEKLEGMKKYAALAS